MFDLSWKWHGKDALAFLVTASAIKYKRFMILTPVVDFVKILHLQLTVVAK
jgi:hypothetical protein